MGFHGFLMDFIRFVTWNLTVRNEDFMGFQLIFRDLMGQVFLPISPSTVGMNGIKKLGQMRYQYLFRINWTMIECMGGYNGHQKVGFLGIEMEREN